MKWAEITPDKDEEVKNAVIESAKIILDDRGILTAWVYLDFGGSGQGFGGYALYLPRSYDHHKKLTVGAHFIYRVMNITGVEDWSQMKGKTVRVLSSYLKCRAIGHIVNDDWFDPATDFRIINGDA